MVGANMAASRDAALAIGFDEELGPGARGFADDVLFNLRLKTAGYRLVGCTGPPAERHRRRSRLNHTEMKSLAGAIIPHAYLWHHWLQSDLQLLGLRRLRAPANLTWIGLSSSPDGDAISERGYRSWFAHSFCEHLAEERSRPRTYSPTGLILQPHLTFADSNTIVVSGGTGGPGARTCVAPPAWSPIPLDRMNRCVDLRRGPSPSACATQAH